MELINIEKDDSIEHSLVEGHLSDREFNKIVKKAFAGDTISSDRITHEYWVKDQDGAWSSSNRNNPKAVPVTVMDW